MGLLLLFQGSIQAVGPIVNLQASFDLTKQLQARWGPVASTDQNDTFWANNHHNLDLYAVKEDLSAKDLTGVTAITWVMKNFAEDPTPILSKTLGSGVTVINAVGGVFRVSLVPTDTAPVGAAQKTGTFYHEAVVTDVTGAKVTVTTGWLVIHPSGA